MRLLDLEIYAFMARYLEGRATLEQFEDWFDSETWRIEQSPYGTPEAVEIASAVRDAMADLEDGEIDDDAFRARLRSLEARRRERVLYFQRAIQDRDPEAPELVNGAFNAGSS
jgi:hypothetical protein